MDKWTRFGTRKKWQELNNDVLKLKFDAYCADEENRFQAQSFDDFCIGIWQRMK